MGLSFELYLHTSAISFRTRSLIQGMSFNISVSVLGRLGHINPLRSGKIPLSCYFWKIIGCVIKRFVYMSVQAATAGAAAKSGGGETSERRQEEEGPAGGDSRGENQTQTSTNKTPRRTLWLWSTASEPTRSRQIWTTRGSSHSVPWWMLHILADPSEQMCSYCI